MMNLRRVDAGVTDGLVDVAYLDANRVAIDDSRNPIRPVRVTRADVCFNATTRGSN